MSEETAVREISGKARTRPPPPCSFHQAADQVQDLGFVLLHQQWDFFGENFTTQGLLEDDVRAGDVRIGTHWSASPCPATPCFKLGAKAGSPAFVAAFLRSRRLGFCLSAVEEGEVGAGDEIRRVSGDAEAPTVARLIEESYFSGD